MTTANKNLVPTVCHSACGLVCGLLAHVEDGVITKVEAQDMPDPRHRHICARGLSTIQMVYHPDRLCRPGQKPPPSSPDFPQQIILIKEDLVVIPQHDQSFFKAIARYRGLPFGNPY